MMMNLHDITLELTTAKANSKFKDCCALILRGEGSSFCAGADFHLASSIATPEQGVLMAELMTDTLTRLRYVRTQQTVNNKSRIWLYLLLLLPVGL